MGRGGGMRAHARSTDPATPHEAAASLDKGKMYASQQAVLSALRVRGPLTDTEIAREIQIHGDGQTYSESRLRTARKELVDKDLVHAAGIDRTGPRRVTIWKATQ